MANARWQNLWKWAQSSWVTQMAVPLLIALLVFSIQFLYPWDERSWQRFFRSVGIGVLILTLVRLWWMRHGSAGVAGAQTAETPQLRDVRWTRDFLLAFAGVTTLFLLIFALQTVYARGFAAALYMFGAGGLLGLASLLSGAILGLLFGIPRSNREREANPPQPGPEGGPGGATPTTSAAVNSTGASARRSATPFRSNTNLEEISDWLTKIIVGLGLTQLSKIPGYVGRLTAFVSHPADPSGGAALTQNVAFAIMTAFSACGFLMGYLLTRLFLMGALVRAEEPAVELASVLFTVAESTPPPRSPAQTPSSELLPESDVTEAMRAKVVSAGISETALRSQIARLAKEYEQLRVTMSPSTERTHAMEKVAAQMKALAITAAPFLEELKKSAAEGERLAAVTFLQVNPDAQSIAWLADRISLEKPFIGYHAAVALLAAVRAFKTTHRNVLEDAVEKGMRVLKEKQNTDRYQVLNAAKRELDEE